MALTRDQIDDLAEEGVFLGNIYEIAQAIEAEVRKQDDAMILQLVEALESARVWKCKEIHHMMREAQYTPAIQAGRARLGEKT